MAGYDMAVDVVSSSSEPSCSLNGPSYRNRAPCALKSGNNKGTGLHTGLKDPFPITKLWNQTYEPLLCLCASVCVCVCVCEGFEAIPLTLIKSTRGWRWVPGWCSCVIEFWCALLRRDFQEPNWRPRSVTSPQVANVLHGKVTCIHGVRYTEFRAVWGEIMFESLTRWGTNGQLKRRCNLDSKFHNNLEKINISTNVKHVCTK